MSSQDTKDQFMTASKNMMSSKDTRNQFMKASNNTQNYMSLGKNLTDGGNLEPTV